MLLNRSTNLYFSCLSRKLKKNRNTEWLEQIFCTIMDYFLILSVKLHPTVNFSGENKDDQLWLLTSECRKNTLRSCKKRKCSLHIRNKRHNRRQMSSILFWLFLHSISVRGGCHYLFWSSLFVLTVTIC